MMSMEMLHYCCKCGMIAFAILTHYKPLRPFHSFFLFNLSQLLPFLQLHSRFIFIFYRLEQATGIAFRFVIGRSKDAKKMAELHKEVEKYKDFIRIDIEEDYLKLPYKS